MLRHDLGPRDWMSTVLRVAGVYNLLWGTAVVVAPALTLRWTGLPSPVSTPQIWQCLGMVVGVYGVGYLIAAGDPYRHWPIVFVGLLGKILGPVGFAANMASGALPPAMFWTILLNDLIWWVPFSLILWGAFRFHQAAATAHAVPSIDDDPLRELIGSNGQTLLELSTDRPHLVLFLRHTGCTFCREALADLKGQRAAIEQTGTGIALVHVGEEQNAAGFLTRYGLGDLPRFSDPQCRLYRQFGLELGGLRELVGPRVWLRGVKAGLLNGHGIGRVTGNPLQMPGAFVLHAGRVLGGFQHEAASDRPDYLALVRQTDRSAVLCASQGMPVDASPHA